jgi:hypothetical protein
MNSVSTPDVFGFLEELVDEQELDEILQEPADQVRAELVSKGADLDRVRQRLEHALGEAEAPAPRKPAAKVIPIQKRKPAPSRAIPILRSISLAVAASFFGIFVWRQGTMRVMPDQAHRNELSDSRPAPPPSYMVETDLQKAKRLRAQAYKLCDQGYWGECIDKLDEAGRLDREGNQTLEVNEARNRAWQGHEAETRGGQPTLVKPSIGPTERPLQRHPR